MSAPELRMLFSPVLTPRLHLRAPELEDAEAIFAVHGDPDTNRFNPDGPMSSIAQAHERLAEWRTEWATAGFGFWAISLHEDPAVLGFGGLSRRRWRDRDVLNVYYRLTPDAWGSGYATEMASAAVALARKHLRRLPILVRARPANTAAQMVACKVGLERRPELDDDFTVFVAGWT